MKKLVPIIILFVSIIFYLEGNSQTTVKNMNSKEGFYTNPIFAGDYPDPSIMRDGADFYMVHSSFIYYPGLIIWHSTDLINWEPVCSALHKYVGSVWAPDLVKQKDKYYIYFPANGTNYVVWAANINGPWSDPIDLKISEIDPGHVVDVSGKRYLHLSGGNCVSLADDGLSVTGSIRKVYDGWTIPTDWSVECFCLEGPKLRKVGDYYYLIVAEGGTAGPATSHMAVVARSKTPFGPWENSPYNPIVHTKSKAEKWWSKGHATLVDDVKGRWWLVFHGYEKGYYNMGRQTLLEPVEWTSDGWFKTPKGIETDQPIQKPFGKPVQGKRVISDDFSGKELGLQWQFYNEFDPTRFQFSGKGIIINAKGANVSDCSPLLVQAADHSYNVQVEVQTEGDAMGALVLFYNEDAFAGIGAKNKDIQWIRRTYQASIEKDKIDHHTFLRLENKESQVNFYYSSDGMKWIKIANSFETSAFNQNAFGGFLSLRIGLCSVGKDKVTFKNFKYEAL